MRQRSLAKSTSWRKLISAGSVESQYLVGSASPSGHSITNHSCDSDSRISRLCPTPTRSRANREDSHPGLLSFSLVTRIGSYAIQKPLIVLESGCKYILPLRR